MEGAGAVRLGDGVAEEGGDGGVACHSGPVERGKPPSRDGGVGARMEEELYRLVLPLIAGNEEGRTGRITC